MQSASQIHEKIEIQKNENAPDSEIFSLKFNDAVYDVKNQTRRRGADEYLRLISGFSGEFGSGKLTAIIGPNGSCKTSFLDLLIGRSQPGSKTSGEILFKNKPRDPKT